MPGCAVAALVLLMCYNNKKYIDEKEEEEGYIYIYGPRMME